MGAYHRSTSRRDLADALSADLSALTHDLHLWVRYFPPVAPGDGGNLDDAWLNYGFPHARILDGNVGYLDIRSFSSGPAAERAASAAISLLVNCDALIVDLRRNGGGSTPAMVRFAGSLFADRYDPRVDATCHGHNASPVQSTDVCDHEPAHVFRS
jgi:hypothetical protein